MAENTAQVEYKVKSFSVNSHTEALTWTSFWTSRGKLLSIGIYKPAGRLFSRGGLKRKESALVKKLYRAKKDAKEKPEAVKTHLRNMIFVSKMVGSIIGAYNGKVFNQIEFKVSNFTFSLY